MNDSAHDPPDSAPGDPSQPADPAGAGDRDPAFVAWLDDELKRQAELYLARERPDHTLQATALVHEAWLRVGERSAVDREHFQAMAALAMRRVLVDHARRRKAARRGGGAWQRITLAEAPAGDGRCEVDLVALNDALERLEARDRRASRVVELRFFGGLTTDEAARALGVSPSTVENDWYVARAWLARDLEEGPGS